MLTGARILVAEDEPLIAMELAQTTADSDGHGQFALWPDAPIVAKPHNPGVILDALSRLLQSRS